MIVKHPDIEFDDFELPECDGKGSHRPRLMRWRAEHNGFWCRRCDLVLAIGEADYRHRRRVTTHNAMRDSLCANYQTLPPLLCTSCGSKSYFPPADTVRIEHKVKVLGASRNYIADVAAFRTVPLDLDGNGGLVAVIEVIDSNPPSNNKLKLQESICAFYLYPQKIKNAENLDGYCSVACWRQFGVRRLGVSATTRPANSPMHLRCH